MSAVEEALVIDQPGVYSIPPHLYHQDPVAGGSLSSTVARMLVRPGGPARYRHGERRDSRAFDFGSLAHLKLLGVGDRIRLIDADSFRTTAAKEARDEAYAAREVPVLTGSDDLTRADAMVKAARENRTVRDLLGQPGRPEQTVVWQERGVWCRAMVDYLPDPRPDRLPVDALDYKTARTADRDPFMAAALRLAYHSQVDWYLRGLRAVGRKDVLRLLLVAQEKEPPYLPNVVDPLLDLDVAREAARLNDEALTIWARCRETGVWPGYDVDPSKPARIPGWWLYELDADNEIEVP